MEKSTHNTLELLAQYDNHTSQRDKTIEDIERRVVSEDTRPSYDDLFKENVKLKLQLKEQETELESLKKLLEGMRSVKASPSVATIVDQADSSISDDSIKKEIVLPPRSANRQKNTKNLFIPIVGSESNIRGLEKPSVSDNKELPSTDDTTAEAHSAENSESPLKVFANKNDSENDVSPATSVTYKTPRITIASPNRANRSGASYTVRSPQSANRVAAVIHNQVHSPLRANLDEKSVVFNSATLSKPEFGSPVMEGRNDPKSPLSQTQALRVEGRAIDFSPSSKQNLNKFADFLEDTFTRTEPDLSPMVSNQQMSPQQLPPPLPSFSAAPRDRDSPFSMKLGSPVILSREENAVPKDSESRIPSNNSSLNAQQPQDVKSAIRQQSSMESLRKKTAPGSFTNSSSASSSGQKKSLAESANSANTQAERQRANIPLFVQPEEFGTIRMDILSTLFHESEAAFKEPQILFSVIDRKSEKEMFKFSKTIHKIYELDAYLKSRIPSLILPLLPERQSMESLVPSKVDARREIFNQYFQTVFCIQKLPDSAVLRIAQFMSTDTVMNPVLLGDTVKEGTLLMRKPKALGSAGNWRVRYGVLGGDVLTLYDREQATDRIRLKQSSIELLPNLPEDKHGTKNGFVINEHKKSGLTSTTKYFICTETSKERELWVSAISEFIVGALIPPSSSAGSLSTNGETGASFAQHTGSADQVYVTDLTLDSGSQNGGDLSKPAPRELEYAVENEESKESKRLKMRSFFPFKRITSNALSIIGDDAETIVSQESEPKFSDSSIAKSLENMNLGSERQPKKVFGSSLEDCLKLSSHLYLGKYEIPSVIYRCLEFLYKNHGIQEEGLFRLSGSSALIKSLQEQFDSEYDVDLFNYNKTIPESKAATSGTYIDVNTVSGLLKLYLRKLPHLIFGEEGYFSFKEIVDEYHDDAPQIAYKFRDLIRNGAIPEANASLMYCLFELLVRIQENQRYNKMNARNLCIVFSPTLNVPVTILQPLIVDFACIFQNGEPLEQDKRRDLDIHIPQV